MDLHSDSTSKGKSLPEINVDENATTKLPTSSNQEITKRNKNQQKYSKQRRFSNKSTDSFSKNKKQQQPRPTHFICIPITNPSILQYAHDIQQHLMAQNPQIEPALIPLKLFHFTLLTLRLTSDDEVHRAKRVLLQCKDWIQPYLKDPLCIESVVGTFGNRVLYFGAKDQSTTVDTLQNLHQHLMNQLKEEGIELPGNKDTYTPHVTIAKLNWNMSRKGFRKIPEEWYWEYCSDNKETIRQSQQQFIQEIHLCAIGRARDKDGFYKRYASLHFDKDFTNINNDPTIT